jgi:predicted MFS family arabinose efflux permease
MTDRRSRYRDVFAVGAFRVVFAVRLLRELAMTTEILGLSVVVYAHTGSPLLSALAFAIGMFPQIVGGALFTSMADRLPPRAVLAVSLLLRAVPGAVIGLLVLPVWAMLVLVGVIACLDPIAAAALGGLLPKILDGDRYVLGRSLINITGSGAQIAGLGLGGALLAAFSARQVLLAAAVALVMAAIVLRISLAHYPAATADSQRGAMRTTLQANRALLADRRVRRLLLAQWLPAWLVTAAEALIVPYIGALHQSADRASVLLAATPVGMFLGDFLVGRFCRPYTRERLAFWLAVTMGLPLMLFVASPPVPIAAVLIAATGFGFSYGLGIEQAFLDALPQNRQGQAFGLRSTGVMTGQGLGPVAAGALATGIGAGPAIAACGGCCVLAALALHAAFTKQRMPPSPDNFDEGV